MPTIGFVIDLKLNFGGDLKVEASYKRRKSYAPPVKVYRQP